LGRPRERRCPATDHFEGLADKVNRLRPRTISPIVVAAVLALSCAGASCDGEEVDDVPLPADAHVRVDLEVPLQTRSVSGFLHGLSEDQPPDRLVATLRPRLWRSNLQWAPLARVKRFGARYTVALSGLWGYPKEGWRQRGPPWRRPREWRAHVSALARLLRGEPIVWEVWNEPNVPGFWDGGRARFFRLYALSEKILRAEIGPSAVVGGPSLAGYNLAWMREFVQFCERAGCRPDFLSWHELLPPDQPIGSVTEHLLEARRELPGAGELHINEYTGPEDQYRPGEAIAYMAALEAGNADFAARACWEATDGSSNCAPGRLDGLVDPTGAVRAVWWAYRWYALGADRRVRASSTDPRLFVLASGGDTPLILLGRGDRDPAPEGIDTQVQVYGLRDLDQPLVAEISRLPDIGERPLAKPVEISNEDLDLTEDPVQVRVPNIGPHEAALVRIAPRSADPAE
jgi:xylan 1,4-beta-xylosidase